MTEDVVAQLDMDIPEAARDHYFTCGCHDARCNRAGYQAEALPLVAAAELRRLADQMDPGEPFTAELLRERADELDPR